MSGISLAWRAALIATKNSRVSCVVQENCLLQQVPLKDLAPPVAAGAEFGCQDFESDLSAFQRRREDAREASCAIRFEIPVKRTNDRATDLPRGLAR